MPSFWSFTEGASAMPLFVVCWTTATFGTSYLTAALRGDVDPILPYISDTAGRPPESCVFGLMLSISALAAALTMFVRYRLVAYATCGRSYAIFVNRTGFAIGLISCLGLLVVANFQNTTEFKVHMTGAGLAFAGGALYSTLHALLSWCTEPRGLACARTALSVWSLASGVTMVVAVCLATWDLTYKYQTKTLLRVSAAAEWSLGVSFLTFFLTFIRDFQGMRFRVIAEQSPEHQGLLDERRQLLPQ
ncbi:DNA damage-regulated autophagy modulator protein 1 [Petromyzon marinus]|uniref:DNA damage-regulated autophagy modulator protein 1 n=1 Tax=Petromyzon marinus TaxID=7757 RepID=A0AAJ7WPR1_PETMA|nr:DNA damage-regulated autophagy modulator protein 1 [Petromyzon marinus]